ncbi:putative Preprotein translocase subunit YajC [Azospirillaceae bacterium]
MMSFNKLVVLCLLVAGAWFGLKWLNRVEQVRRAQRKQTVASSQEAMTLVKCRVCGVYAQAQSCGRNDCPNRA